MPLGSIWEGNRLGLGNPTMPLATQYAYNVLDIWYTLPIYQQQLVRGGLYNYHGCTKASADWNCSAADGEGSNPQTIREISAVDTQYARRNLSQGNQNLFNHRSTNYNQIYYLNNEPEFGNVLGIGDPLCDCWTPNDRGIDPAYSNLFAPNTSTLFWQPWSVAQAITVQCNGSPIIGSGKRIYPKVLAWLYLRTRRETANLNRGHSVVPPSTIDIDFGQVSGLSSYWYDFYKAVLKDGATVNGLYEAPTSPTNLRALHVHGYSWPNGNASPLQKVLEDSKSLLSGCAWFQARLNEWFPGQYTSLPVNILLSEMGPLWGDQVIPGPNGTTISVPGKWNSVYYWRGIWTNFRQALSWWNSWLCWLTRRAPVECNLQNWQNGTNSVYPCIHEPNDQPFVARNVPTSYSRTQKYLNLSPLAVYPWNSCPTIDVPSPVTNPGLQGYQNSFSVLQNTTYWQQSTWARTPLGACYTVWAKVGPDPVTQNINTGWASNTQAGLVATATVALPPGPGYATVYFPIIKGDAGAFGNTELTLKWFYGSSNLPHGTMMLNDIEDTGNVTFGNLTGFVYSAMVYPVVIYNGSSSGQQVTVQITRTQSGPTAWLGRPIALKGGCSWFINQ